MKIRDYVIATKYKDGDSEDYWCVGFIDKIVIDSDGKYYYINTDAFDRGPFLKSKKISGDEGWFFVTNAEKITRSGKSIWRYLREIRSGKIDLCE